jgi:hypothetical protein
MVSSSRDAGRCWASALMRASAAATAWSSAAIRP